MARLADALKRPDERMEEANAIGGLIERIMLSPGKKWSEVHATLCGDLATIVEWTENGGGKGGSGTPESGLSVSVNTGTRGGVRSASAVNPPFRAPDRRVGLAPRPWEPGLTVAEHASRASAGRS